MTSRTFEEAVEKGKDHEWCGVGGLHLRVNDGSRYVAKKLSAAASEMIESRFDERN